MSSPVTHAHDDCIANDIGSRSPKLTRLTTAAAHFFAAVRAGLTSMHQYEGLRAHGESHASAMKKSCAFE